MSGAVVVSLGQRVIARLDERGLLDIVRRHARAHHVGIGDVCGGSRTKNVAAARHATWLEIRDTTSLSFPEIASLFGVDHTTVMAGAAKAASLPSLRSEFLAFGERVAKARRELRAVI